MLYQLEGGQCPICVKFLRESDDSAAIVVPVMLILMIVVVVMRSGQTLVSHCCTSYTVPCGWHEIHIISRTPDTDMD